MKFATKSVVVGDRVRFREFKDSPDSYFEGTVKRIGAVSELFPDFLGSDTGIARYELLVDRVISRGKEISDSVSLGSKVYPYVNGEADPWGTISDSVEVVA